MQLSIYGFCGSILITAPGQGRISCIKVDQDALSRSPTSTIIFKTLLTSSFALAQHFCYVFKNDRSYSLDIECVSSDT